MTKPVLVVLAAGMGSRYGGMKQLDPVGPNGQIIIDYSIFDARRAGFETVIFIIRRENDAAFRAAIGDRLSHLMEVKYAYQELSDLPAPFTVPEGRTKPFGTGQAVLSARELIDGPFAVINADDYYGPEAFRVMYDYLSTHPDTDKYQYCMVGYQLKNTVTQNGSVSRGVCVADPEGMLESVTERTKITQEGGVIHFTEDEGKSWTELPGDTPVSMGLWGFTVSFLPEAQNDMIFSIICEELGLVGASAIVLLFLVLIWRFFVIATRAKDLFGALIASGAMAHMMIQVILNIAVVTNTIPNTGITLPFISYGGTSVMFLLLEMGLVLSVSSVIE